MPTRIRADTSCTDQWGNIIAELDATGATVREYIWLVEAEIAPTRGAGGRLDEGESPAPRQNVDRPIAVVSNVSTTPALLMVHVDQLHRPMKMTDGSGAVIWSAVYSPFGGAYTLSGSETLNARFPGQWFQLEAGLHYNWHRHYDPTLGRYTQPDPLGFVDGPSVYAYVKNLPTRIIDTDGRIGRPKGKNKEDYRSRACNANELAKCEATCAPNPVWLCQVSQVRKVFGLYEEEDGTISVLKSWEDKELICKCDVPECQ